MEVSDATGGAAEAVNETGGSIKAIYRTKNTLRNMLKPHKYEGKEFKIPMPPPKKVLKMEKMKEKGLEVEYPRAPWYNDNVDELLKEVHDREKRISEGEFADLYPQHPADRSEGCGKDLPRVQREALPRVYKFKL